ncbi:hypothetical protein BRAS3843_1040026 [Bradyrhizobium sp. STM 3843]|nr:hypothetical protein BRAS3843_1040026 [Bradyrhizobium sp. STM 3843]
MHGRVRGKTEFVRGFNPITPVQTSREKYSRFAFSEFVVCSSRPASMRGALRDRHERWVRDAMDVQGATDECGRRGRSSRMVLASRC